MYGTRSYGVKRPYPKAEPFLGRELQENTPNETYTPAFDSDMEETSNNYHVWWISEPILNDYKT